ncbi:nucleotidyltransferase family protein [Bacterioplanoides sp.]|uniref:nucleotidyltransferase family protein n=1 Tax=Bacterioplanoides sp. TaxID=2066072 RepID=UPI003B5BE925
MTVGVVLLAAGRSQRFGSDKRHAPFPESEQVNTSVFFSTLSQIRASKLPCFVVLRPGDQALGQQLDQLNIEWGICPDADQGMGHSLAFGVHSTQHWQGWLIALADMPWVLTTTYQTLANHLNGENIVRPCVTQSDATEKPGNPVAFSQTFAFQLMQCSGDSGARHVVKANPDKVENLLLNDPGILRDIDQPADLPN